MTTVTEKAGVQLSGLSTDEMEWTEEMKVLAIDRTNYSVEYLLNVPAGPPSGKHKHLCETYAYVIQGGFKNHTTGVEYGAGDFLYQPHNDVHVEDGGTDGALIYVSLRGINPNGNVFEFYGTDNEVVGTMAFNDFVQLLPTE